MITFSSHNQDTFNGAKEYAIWYHRDNSTSRRIGTAFKTNYGDWCAHVDNNKGSIDTHLHRQFKVLKRSVAEGWL